MKIEWLNGDLTEAIVTRGWFRKRQAHVRLGRYEKMLSIGLPLTVEGWVFATTGNHVGWWVSWSLDDDRRMARERLKRGARRTQADSEWVPVRSLPEARVVERKP
jgi:hypothetical protein